MSEVNERAVTCKGGSLWPPLVWGTKWYAAKRGGHGEPPLQDLTTKNRFRFFTNRWI